MIRLGSNGRGSKDALPWLGTDKVISYPQVSTCITVTAVVGSTLVGCHLFYLMTNEQTVQDLAEFGRMAAGASKIYLVGMLTNWAGTGRNRTGLSHVDGSLLDAICNACSYTGVVEVYDTSGKGEIVITAEYVSAGVARISYGKDAEDVQVLKSSEFLQSASRVIPVAPRSSWCNIL